MRFNLKFTLSQKVPFQPNLFSFWRVRNYSLIMSESLLTNFYSLSLLLILSLLWWSGSCSFIYKTFSFPKSSFAFLPLSLSRHHLMLLLSLCSHWLHLSLWKCFLSLSLSLSLSRTYTHSHTYYLPLLVLSFSYTLISHLRNLSLSHSLNVCITDSLSIWLTHTFSLSLPSPILTDVYLPSRSHQLKSSFRLLILQRWFVHGKKNLFQLQLSHSGSDLWAFLNRYWYIFMRNTSPR